MTKDEARARVVGTFPIAKCKNCGKRITDAEMQELFPELGGCFSDCWGGKTEYCDCRSIIDLPAEFCNKIPGVEDNTIYDEQGNEVGHFQFPASDR